MEDLVDIPFPVRRDENGVRVDVFLSRRIARMSRTQARDIILTRTVRINGETLLKPSRRLRNGDTVVMRRRPLIEAPTDDIELPIAYEDEHFLAIVKPGNLVVHPTATAYRRTVIRILRERSPGQYLALAHRLDKETSGLLVLAKRPEVTGALMDMFGARRVEKTYLAIVAGRPPADSMQLDAPLQLAPDSLTNCLMQVGGQNPSLTEVNVRARHRDAALVEALPRTGRQHQIRLHLAHAGLPIIGDKLYLGGEDIFIDAINRDMDGEQLSGLVGHWRHALHAAQLKLRHPVTGADLCIQAAMPPDMMALAARFGLSV